MKVNSAKSTKPESHARSAATAQIAPSLSVVDRPTQAEYIAWRIHVLSSPDYAGDRSGDVLPSGTEIRSMLTAARRH